MTVTSISSRIRWGRDRATGAAVLPRLEAERVFRIRTGRDPYDLEPVEAAIERSASAEDGPLDKRGCLQTVIVMCALDNEVRARKARQAGITRAKRPGQPPRGDELQKVLAMLVQTLGGPANAALYIWLNGLEQSAAHCLRPPRSSDEVHDTKEAYRLLIQRLDLIAKKASALPALTEFEVPGPVTVGQLHGEGSVLRVLLRHADEPNQAEQPPQPR